MKTSILLKTVYFLGMFVADAVSMPVHWYYDASKIKEDYIGWISKYEKPNKHPSCASGLTRPKPGSSTARYFVGKMECLPYTTTTVQ